jgi:hypothetical protein
MIRDNLNNRYNRYNRYNPSTVGLADCKDHSCR